MGLAALFWANLRILIAGGDGVRQVVERARVAGLKPCWRRPNIWQKESGVVDPGHLPHDTDRRDLFQTRTRNTLMALEARARRRHATGVITKELEKNKTLGLHPSSRGFCADGFLMHAINVRKVFSYDWPRTLLQEGVLSYEMVAFINCLEDKRVFTNLDCGR